MGLIVITVFYQRAENKARARMGPKAGHACQPFTPADHALFRRLSTPARIQRFVDELTYQ
jgi:hypothetical protein